jgi:NAD(P)-dependent dehydrogenase (short-subunit alcohol dehydrogenase family)
MADTGYAGRYVLVFGAAGALGAGVAAAFADAGASVTGVDRAVPPPERRLADIDYQALDVLDGGAIGDLFGCRQAPWAVINTIGGYAPARSLAELDPAELRAQLELNLVSAALVTKYALRALLEAGRGRIVHTASRAGVVPAGSGFAYSVSKAGVLHLVSMAAAEVRGSGVTVNCVVPTIIDTPANRAALPSADFDAWPKVSDVARAYVYLASPDAGLVNGAALPV